LLNEMRVVAMNDEPRGSSTSSADILLLRIEAVKPDKAHPRLLLFCYEWFYLGEQNIRRGFQGSCSIEEYPPLRDLREQYRKLINEIENIADDRVLAMLFAADGTSSQGELVGLEPSERRNYDMRLRRVLSDLKQLSADLTRKLVPMEIAEEMEKLKRDTPILLITDQMEIPWELVRVKSSQFLPLWGTKFALGRLLLTSETGADTGSLNLVKPKVLYINPLCVQSDPLPGNWLENGMRPDNMGFSDCSVQLLLRKDATFQRVVDLLETGDYDLIYYSGHVQIGEDDQAQLSVYDQATMYHDEPTFAHITADTIRICHRTRKRSGEQEVSRSAPIVFLNGCQTATLVCMTEADEEKTVLGKLSSYDGLAKAFIDYGACVVLATLWPVVYSHSVSFANYLLECLRMKQYSTIGSVLRVTKERFNKDYQHLAYKEFHFLPYILYGAPSMADSLKEKEIVRFSYWGEQFHYLFDSLQKQALSLLPRGLSVETIGAGYDIVDVVFRQYREGEYRLPFVVVAPILNVAREYLSENTTPIRIVGVLFEPAKTGSAILLARRREIRKLTDLAGKAVGVTGWHMFPTFALKNCLRKAGLRPVDFRGYGTYEIQQIDPTLAETLVRLYNYPQSSLAKALQDGFLDAVLLFWPVVHDTDLTAGTSAIADPVAMFWQDNPDISLPVTVLATHNDFLQAPDSRAAIITTLDTIVENFEWVLMHRDDVVREQARVYGVPEEQAERLFDIQIHKEVYVRDKPRIVESLFRIWREAGNLEMLPRNLTRAEVQEIVWSSEALTL
jgi:ABC-type nitrate/sulfonate/bicarbonate transport system substrate-binding protein